METTQTDTEEIGATIAAAYSLGGANVSDHGTPSELAGRRLEQVLVRGCSAHLLAALRAIADDFSPTPVRATEPNVTTKAHV